MEDPLSSGSPGSGFDSPGDGPSIFPMGAGGGSVAILPASSPVINASNLRDGTPALPIFGADTLVVQTSGLTQAFPTVTLAVQYSTDGFRWVDSAITITTATATRLNSTSGSPVGHRFARVIVTSAASGSEKLITITVTALRTGT